MGNKLLVRAYNVEVGDCIYCRIPGARVHEGADNDDFHILIDCGSKSSESLLRDAVKHLESSLPDTPTGKKRLDLLVVTHEHQDHIKGFNPKFFKDIEIGNIWLSVAMNPDHPQAQKTHSLHQAARLAMQDIAARRMPLSSDLLDLANLYSIKNDLAVKAIREDFPKANNIEPKYVHASMGADELKLPLEGASIKVLGPEKDIDGFYLGEDLDPLMRGFSQSNSVFSKSSKLRGSKTPKNISPTDFHVLQTRMVSGAFEFAELESRVKNNTSVILLIEWKGKRLLFVGDCEWEHEYKANRKNGGWNVMWHERRAELDAPIDFLKIGHHGSVNSTPWNDKQDGEVTEPSTILDAILPVPAGGEKPDAKAIVSTKRKNYQTIPSSALMTEIGKRVKSVKTYSSALRFKGHDPEDLPKYDRFEKKWINKKQPLRTDLEHILDPVGFTEVEIEA